MNYKKSLTDNFYIIGFFHLPPILEAQSTGAYYPPGIISQQHRFDWRLTDGGGNIIPAYAQIQTYL